ncbi:MAG: tetratricopeptide repeat protein [bacterium]|nr:tetratricopeptide repeat protein [bacterium]MDD5354242.1 tetratricopeptide repeat protein [bacterium]MDD5756071.1 tetratricopeptide repeat protein [bacterium]
MLRKLFYLAIILAVCFAFYRQILVKAQEYVDQHAQEAWAPKVQLQIGKVYSFTRSYSQAEATFLQLKKKYPKSTYAAKAQYMIASIYEKKEDYGRAKVEYEKFKKDYPADEYSRKVEDKLRILALFQETPKSKSQ